ncbi:MAG: WYL domain-containing protein [Pyrinomonadaceae bacterium]|nr:WYL domain-containing protein [Pyrinomonadaceae bacterium]
MSYRQALTERLIRILFKLIRRAHSRQELAREFGVNHKTICRDLDALGLEYPIIEEKRGREVFYKFSDDFKFDFPQIEIEELATLLLAQEAIAGIGITAGNSFYSAQANSLIGKVRSSLPRSVKANLDALSKVYGSAIIPAKNFSAHAAVIDRLAFAAVRLKVIQIRYHSLNRDRDSSRRIAPYSVYFDPDGATLKLIAFDATHGEIRVFSVERISNLIETNENFIRPADFDLSSYLRDNCFNGIHGKPVTVRLKAKGITARIFAERSFHPSQKIIERKHKRGASPETIVIEMTVASGRGLERFILGWLPDIEVISPKEVHENINRILIESLKSF